MKIKINNEDYKLNTTRAIKTGALVKSEQYPLNPGDVYVAKEGYCNPFLLVEALYGDESPRRYCLLGLGLMPNSNRFHHNLHSLSEVTDYLREMKMRFSHNIQVRVSDMVYNK